MGEGRGCYGTANFGCTDDSSLFGRHPVFVVSKDIFHDHYGIVN